MSPLPIAEFDDVDLLPALQRLDGPALDRLAFGVIGFDRAGIVTTYNAAESAAATGNVLDVTIPFVLSWRMKPQQVRLRLMFSPGSDTSYLAIQRA